MDAEQKQNCHTAIFLQNQMEEIVRLQDVIDGLQSSFTEELMSDVVDSDSSDQLAMQSTLTVLAERMATIHMKASGKRQLLEVYLCIYIYIYKKNFSEQLSLVYIPCLHLITYISKLHKIQRK